MAVEITGVHDYAIDTKRQCTVSFSISGLLLGDDVSTFKAALRSVEWDPAFPSTARYSDDGRLVVTFEVQRAGEVVHHLDVFMARVDAEWQRIRDEVGTDMETIRSALATRFGDDAVPTRRPPRADAVRSVEPLEGP
jgi:hypothetical protein